MTLSLIDFQKLITLYSFELWALLDALPSGYKLDGERSTITINPDYSFKIALSPPN